MGFWEQKTLSEMTDAEWESLCDGCGLCCLHKLEDVETLLVEFTCVKCRYLGTSRQCEVYDERVDIVDDCLNVRDLGPRALSMAPRELRLPKTRRGQTTAEVASTDCWR